MSSEKARPPGKTFSDEGGRWCSKEPTWPWQRKLGRSNTKQPD